MKDKTEFEIAKLKKDVNGLIEVMGESKDRMQEIEEEVALQGKTLKSMQDPAQGLNQTGRRLLAKLSSKVDELDLAQQLDRSFIKSTALNMQQMAAQFTQTVAANDC